MMKTRIHHSAATDYERVTLCSKGKGKDFFVHVLIMLTFEGPCPDGMDVCHVNGKSLENRFDNLKYDTHEANIRFNIWMQTQQKEADWKAAQPEQAEAAS